MLIPQNCLSRQFGLYQAEYEAAALRCLRSGWYILGREVEAFEKEFAAFVSAKHCVGLASGLDALWIAFRILGIRRGR
jgi:dTDP-4-amino-4,6-dideoxygalactose transaminase